MNRDTLPLLLLLSLLLLPQLASAWLPGGGAWNYRNAITPNGSTGAANLTDYQVNAG